MNARLGRVGLAGALGVAALVRVALLLHHRGAPGWATTTPGLDAALYHELGVRVASGDLALGDAVYHYAPLPAYVQGAVYALLGPDPTWMPWFHLAAGLVVVALVYAMANRIGGPLAAVVAALLAALYAPFVHLPACKLLHIQP